MRVALKQEDLGEIGCFQKLWASLLWVGVDNPSQSYQRVTEMERANLRFRPMAKGAARVVQHRLGARMQALRADRELTQEAVADRIGISQKYLSELERGQKSPSWET